MGNKSAPAAPDFTQAARETAQSAQSAMDRQTVANRPNTYFGDGSKIEYTRTGDPTYDQRAAAAGEAAYQQALSTLSNGRISSMATPEMRQRLAEQARQRAMAGVERAPDEWEMHQTLSPEAQAALQAQQRIGASRSALAESLLGRAQTELGTPPDWSSLPQIGTGMEARQRAEDAMYRRATSRLDPQWQQREDAMRQQLANQGIDIGSEAYRAAQGDFSRGRNDAYQAAMDQSIMGGGQEMSRQFGQDVQARQQALAEMLQRRGLTLNEINAALSGQQVSMPGMQMPGNTAGAAQGANLLGAAQMQGNYGLQAQQMSNQMWSDMMGGAMSLGKGFMGF